MYRNGQNLYRKRQKMYGNGQEFLTRGLWPVARDSGMERGEIFNRRLPKLTHFFYR
jgi:hypothetical protein